MVHGLGEELLVLLPNQQADAVVLLYGPLEADGLGAVEKIHHIVPIFEIGAEIHGVVHDLDRLRVAVAEALTGGNQTLLQFPVADDQLAQIAPEAEAGRAA